jgi:ADP-heptose:LPS heptosyltransferase
VLAPLIAGLRAAGHRLDILLSESNRDVFAAGVFDATFSAPRNAWKTRNLQADFATLLTRLRTRRYDRALIATEEISAYRLARAADIPKRCGFENGWGKPLKTLLIRRLCTSTVYRPASLREAVHEASVQYRLAQGLGAPAQPTRDLGALSPLFISDPPPRGATIALQAGIKWERLGLGDATLAGVLARLRRMGDVRVFVHPSEAAQAHALADAHDLPVDSFDGIEPWKRAIARARLLVTPDTGAAHIAGMLGTPTVDCFSNKEYDLQIARWAPWAAPYETVRIGDDAEDTLERIIAAATRLISPAPQQPR